jgi:preprotein translocase subunit YajC
VITTGGLYGTIEGLTETTLQLKIANQVKVKISRSAIAGVQQVETTENE